MAGRSSRNFFTPPIALANDAPSGAETAQVVRAILRKKTIIETTTPLGANAVFTGAWHDSELDGTSYVIASSFSNVIGAAGGLVIQESDDNTNANFTRNAVIYAQGAAQPPAGALLRLAALIRARYWRVTYTNGAGAQANFELTTCAMNFEPTPIEMGAAGTIGPEISRTNIYLSGGPATYADNNLNVATLPNSSGNVPGALAASALGYGGAFSGTADAARQGWSKRRIPTVFKTVSTSAAGNTAVWTPGAGNKFRLLRVFIEITDNAALGAAGILTITMVDGAANMPIAIDVFVPNAAGAQAGDALHEGLIDLGDFGILSAAANNVLNINLSAALTSGICRVIVMGTEE